MTGSLNGKGRDIRTTSQDTNTSHARVPRDCHYALNYKIGITEVKPGVVVP